MGSNQTEGLIQQPQGTGLEPVAGGRELQSREAGRVDGGSPSVVRRVLVVGDSNVARVRGGLLARVKGDKRVTVVAQPGKCMVDAMDKAKEELWGNMEGDNLVVVHAGLNDVLKGRSQNLGRQIEAGVNRLREVSGSVHVEICTIPEVWGQSYDVERRVVNANGVIKRMSRRLEYGVVDINKEVNEARSDPFPYGVHYSGDLGGRVGDRLGRRAAVFLDGPGHRRASV